MRPTALSLVPITALALVSSVLALDPPTESKPSDSAVTGDVNPRWLLKLDKEDRQFVDETVGYAPPALNENLTWVEGEARSWDEFKGKVIVLQTWSSQSAAARTWPARAARATESWSDSDVVVIAVHTPEGADKAEQFLERRELEMLGIIDSVGEFCDDLGAFKKPVNFVIDRAGTVRYAGLNEEGLTKAVADLVEEDASVLPEPKQREGEAVAAKGPRPPFPPTSGSVGSAMDVRGKRAPDFFVQQWVGVRPSVEGKVMIIDFWATWCGPCVAAIPHMNELAAEFKDEVAIIGISDESQSDYAAGLKRRGLEGKINYNIALDTSSKMANAIQVRGIPHVIVISSDWVVRWQGHPAAGLTKELIREIVDANGEGGATTDARRRWTAPK
jgi:thiol-disulfide isomerase/thioredoxin